MLANIVHGVNAAIGFRFSGMSLVTNVRRYAEVGRTWGPTLERDQEIAGGLLWASGDLVGLLVLGALFVQWAQASEREAVREDRRLDRLDAERAAATGTPTP